jgi:hypothetical protein
MAGWATSNFGDVSGRFETLHVGLTVELIATPRAALKTCSLKDEIAQVITGNIEQYDYLPVIKTGCGEGEGIAGLLFAKAFLADVDLVGTVEDHFRPLSEDLLIGADSSILDFIIDADLKPCRLVVSGARIFGLVSLSDLQRLPVRAALFALVTGFEITMMEAIRRWFENEDDWMNSLSDNRREFLNEQKKKSFSQDGLINSLLFTQFADKKRLVTMRYPGQRSKASLKDILDKVEKLRDFVAHANDYAATPEQARNVCVVVRNLIELRKEIANSFGSQSGAGL